MDFLRAWLLGVIACAVLVSIAEQLCPEGAVRRVVHFTGGLLLLAVMLRPWAGAAAQLPGKWGAGYRVALEQADEELRAQQEKQLAHGIEEKLEAYIEDKAEDLDTPVRAELETQVRGGIAVPVGVTLHGAYSEELARWLEEDFGIAKEKQVWNKSG